jgi:peptidoglycan/LPS O-acetylase OafA/YrhL
MTSSSTPPTTTAPHLSYRADIDGLRAIAVLLVVIFHFRLAGNAHSGFIGVDIFFVISGYLITQVIHQDLLAQRFTLAQFWLKRVRRLAPALLAVMLGTLAWGWLTLMPQDFKALAQHALAAQTYVANIYFWRNVNYFGFAAADVQLLHTWSLAVEEQFYLLFPLAMLLVWRFARRHLVLCLVIAALLSFALNLWFVGRKPEATFYLMPTRAWELLAGALLALLPARWWQAPSSVRLAVGAAGLGCIAVALLTHQPSTPFPGWFALWPVAAGVALLWAGGGGDHVLSRALSHPVATYIGKISYPLYLVHWPVNVYAGSAHVSGYGAGWRAAMLLLSVALAAAIYHFIEQPVRKRLVLRTDRPMFGAYLATTAATVALAGVIVFSQGLPQRYAPEVLRLAAYANDRGPAFSECEYGTTLCTIGDTRAEPTWLVYGDSHAWATRAVFDQWLKRSGKSAYFTFLHACPPIKGFASADGRDQCAQFNERVVQAAAQKSSVRKVFVVSVWAMEDSGDNTPDGRAGWREQLGQTLGVWHGMGKQVYVWEPVPGALGHVPRFMAAAARTGQQQALEPSLAEYRARREPFFATLQANAAVVTGRFSPSAALCRTERCSVTIDGQPAYSDNNHITHSSAAFWAQALEQQLGAP